MNSNPSYNSYNSYNKYISHLLIIFLLFFPNSLFQLYYIGSIFIILFLIGQNIKLSSTSLIFIFIILLIFLSSVISSLYYPHVNLNRNITEIIRFIPVLLLITFQKQLNLEFTNLIFYLKFFILINFILSIFQFSGSTNSVITFLTQLYGSKEQIDASLGLASRSLGINSGPGQNGVITAISYSILFASLLKNSKVNFFDIISLVLCVITILLSQSQTAFIVIIGITIYALFASWYFKINKARASAIILFFIGSLVLILPYYISKLSYLSSLFEYGLKRNSYLEREKKLHKFFEASNDNPFFTLLGHSKDYFGPTAGSMDNEYIFYYGVYGLIVFLIYIFILSYIVLLPYLKKKYMLIPPFLALHLSVVSGIVLAWPSSFTLDPRLLSICIILYILTKRDSQAIKLNNTIYRNN